MPSTCKAGDPILVGAMPGIVLDDFIASFNAGGDTVLFNGSFDLNVLGSTSVSPIAGHALKPGDKVYYDGGTLDAATNVTTGGTLDANTGGTLFGNIDPTGPGVGSGLTVLANVVISSI